MPNYAVLPYEKENDGIICTLLLSGCGFDAPLYQTDSSLSAIGKDWVQGTAARIYGDDVRLHEDPQITRSTYEEYKIHIFYDPLMAIANAAIQK